MDELDDFDDYLKLLHHPRAHARRPPRHDPGLRAASTTRSSASCTRPTSSQPNWFVEGLAVLQETRQTTAGRLRSAFFEMHLRIAVPRGPRCSSSTRSRTDRSSSRAARRRTCTARASSSTSRTATARRSCARSPTATAASLIPGGMNRIAARALGVGYVDPWGRALGRLADVDVPQVRARGGGGCAAAASRASAGSRTRRPARAATGSRRGSSPTATLVYLRSNSDQAPAFVRLDPATAARRTLAEVHGAGHAVPTPDGRALIFHRTNYIPLRWRDLGRLARLVERHLSPRPRDGGAARADPRAARRGARHLPRRHADRLHARRPRDTAHSRSCPSRAASRASSPTTRRASRIRRRGRPTGSSSPTHVGSRAASATSTSSTSRRAPTARSSSTERSTSIRGSRPTDATSSSRPIARASTTSSRTSSRPASCCR